MNRICLEKYIEEVYGAVMEHPWTEYPEHGVFRHAGNRKWFALIMEIPAEKLGIPKAGMLAVANLKCDPFLVGSLCMEDGIFPAYHMNKNHWITVALDGSVPEDKIHMLLDMSYELTAAKKRRTAGREQE